MSYPPDNDNSMRMKLEMKIDNHIHCQKISVEFTVG